MKYFRATPVSGAFLALAACSLLSIFACKSPVDPPMPPPPVLEVPGIPSGVHIAPSGYDTALIWSLTGQSSAEGRILISTFSRRTRRSIFSRPETTSPQIDDLEVEDLLAAERQELVGEVPGPLGRLDDLLDVGSALVVGTQTEEEDLCVAEDRRQHVVEVVGDPGGEQSDGLELLCLTELLLDALAVADVATCQDGAHESAAVAPEDRHGRLEPQEVTLGMAVAVLDAAARGARLEGCAHGRAHRADVIGVHEVQARSTQEVGRVMAQVAAKRRADVLHRAVRPDLGDDVQHVVGDEAQPLLPVLERGQGALPLDAVREDLADDAE